MSLVVDTKKLASPAAPPNPESQSIDCTDISKAVMSTDVSMVSTIVSLVTSPKPMITSEFESEPSTTSEFAYGFSTSDSLSPSFSSYHKSYGHSLSYIV